jgi:hypothetical protein
MAFKCEGCETVVDVKTQYCSCKPKKPQWKFFNDEKDGKTEVLADWEKFASIGYNTETIFSTLEGIAGQNGLPDKECLGQLLKKVDMPDSKEMSKQIAFNVVAGTYDNQTSKLNSVTTLLPNAYIKSSGKGASKCAELVMWNKVSNGVKTHNYLGVGQQIAPCDLCCARYSGLAKQKKLTIIVCYNSPYDKRPTNAYLVFTPTGTVYLSKKKS